VNDYRPDRSLAADLCRHLLDATEAFREARLSNDPEGRTMSLGVSMFTGVVMAAVPFDRRDEMCDAMQGFALTADETLRNLG
jgi:hypothetical protein